MYRHKPKHTLDKLRQEEGRNTQLHGHADAIGALTAPAAFRSAKLFSTLKWDISPNKDPEYWIPCPNKASD